MLNIELLKVIGLVESGKSSKGTSFCNLKEEVRIENNIDTGYLENLGFKFYESATYGDKWTFWGSLDSIGKPKEKKEFKPFEKKADQTPSIQKMNALNNAVTFCAGKSLEEVVKTARLFLNFLREE